MGLVASAGERKPDRSGRAQRQHRRDCPRREGLGHIPPRPPRVEVPIEHGAHLALARSGHHGRVRLAFRHGRRLHAAVAARQTRGRGNLRTQSHHVQCCESVYLAAWLGYNPLGEILRRLGLPAPSVDPMADRRNRMGASVLDARGKGLSALAVNV